MINSVKYSFQRVFLKFSVCILFSFPSFIIAQNNSQPNIIFIFCDDLNSAGLGTFDNSQAVTPHLDALSNESVVFTNAHANAPICGPSRASVFSGALPSSSGYYGFKQSAYDWRSNEYLASTTSMFRHFKNQGYLVLASGKIYHASQNTESDFSNYNSLPYQGPFPFDRRTHSDLPEIFNLTDLSFAPLESIPSYPEATGWFAKGQPYYFENDSMRDPLGDEITALYCENSLATLALEQSPPPFFMTLGMYAPHSPFHVPQKYFDLYPIDSIDVSQFSEENIYPAASLGNRFNSTSNQNIELLQRESPDEDPLFYLKRYIQGYLASVSYLDDQIGKILQSVEDHGFSDNTYIIFSSDHGFHLGDKGIIKKSTLWRQSTQVPLFIRGPGIPTGVSTNPVSLVDLYPTFLNLAGLPNPEHSLDGSNLTAIANNQNYTGTIMSVPSAQFLEPGQPGETTNQHHALTFREYTYAAYSSGEDELFNNDFDPQHANDLSSSMPYQAARDYLRGLLETRLGQLKALEPSYEKLFYGDFTQDLNGWTPSGAGNGVTIAAPNSIIESKHVVIENANSTELFNPNLSSLSQGLYDLRFKGYSESDEATVRLTFLRNGLFNTLPFAFQDINLSSTFEEYSISQFFPENISAIGRVALKIEIVSGNGVHLDDIRLISLQELEESLIICNDAELLIPDLLIPQVPLNELEYVLDPQSTVCTENSLTRQKWFSVQPSTSLGLFVAQTGPKGDPLIELWSDCSAETSAACFNQKTNKIEFAVIDSIDSSEPLIFRVLDVSSRLAETESVRALYLNLNKTEVIDWAGNMLTILPIQVSAISPNKVLFEFSGIEDNEFLLVDSLDYNNSGTYDISSFELPEGGYGVRVAYRLSSLNILVPFGPTVSIGEIGGIQHSTEGNHYDLFPNPLPKEENLVTLSVDMAKCCEGPAVIELIDLGGKSLRVWEFKQLTDLTQLEFPNSLPQGLYLLKIRGPAGEITTLKISI
ncbi:MAG: sulfatase-like hydrolase/transferase [Flavobacteriales bacterium]|nr:sulfatase-like hydrolase/transferase [Flavobacteriales bacterium]